MKPTQPIAFAHRGASAYAPGNTIEAFRLALQQGATGLESDAWLSADGVVMLVHDRTIRSPGRRIDVTRSRSADLAEWGVPTLSELYHACGTGFELSIDLEQPEVALPVLETARAAGADGRLWACHDDLDLLAGLRATSREVRLVCSTRPQRMAEGLPAHVERLATLGIDALNMRWRHWTAGWVAHCHALGIAAFGWDAQEPAVIAGLLGHGIDGIYSDYPDRLVAAMTGQG